jgi:hypothetical protein
MKMTHLGLLAALAPTLLLGGCFESSTSSDDGFAATTGVYAVATDYKTAYALQAIGDSTATTVKEYPDAIGGGVALSAAGGVLYVLNQATGEMQAWKEGSILHDVNVGPSSNPYQVVKAGAKLYVVRNSSSRILVLNENCDSVGAIDLSASANADGNVNPAKAAFVGGKIWILAQRYTASYSFDSGMVILADTGASSKAPRGTTLSATNPMGIAVLGNSVYVASHGGYGSDKDGGYDLFDLTGKHVKSLSRISDGRPSALVAAAGRLWAVAAGAWPAAGVVPVSEDGAEGTPLAGPAAVNDLVTDGTDLWIADRAAGDAHGVWKFAAATGAKASYVKTALPPSYLAVVQ